MLTPLRTLATRTRPASRLPALLPRSLLSATFHSSPTPRRPSGPLPWFVDPSSAPSPLSPAAAPLATAPVPTLPPSHLSPALHPLHDHLSVSPFFDKEALTYIHAREKDPEGSWCDWVVIATLREGRERGIRGAAEGVRTFLAKSPLDLADPTTTEEALFSPSASSPLVSGIPPSPSKHARSRSQKGGPPPTRAEQATGWAMVDAGRVVVHCMTKEARETYGRGIEEVWEMQGPSEGARRRAEEEREREMKLNMEEVRSEMEEEERLAAAEASQRA